MIAGLQDDDSDLPSGVALVHVVATDDTAVEQRSEAAVLHVDELSEALPFLSLGHAGMGSSVLPTDLHLHRRVRSFKRVPVRTGRARSIMDVPKGRHPPAL